MHYIPGTSLTTTWRFRKFENIFATKTHRIHPADETDSAKKYENELNIKGDLGEIKNITHLILKMNDPRKTLKKGEKKRKTAVILVRKILICIIECN